MAFASKCLYVNPKHHVSDCPSRSWKDSRIRSVPRSSACDTRRTRKNKLTRFLAFSGSVLRLIRCSCGHASNTTVPSKALYANNKKNARHVRRLTSNSRCRTGFSRRYIAQRKYKTKHGGSEQIQRSTEKTILLQIYFGETQISLKKNLLQIKIS